MAYTSIKIQDPRKSIADFSDKVKRFGMKIDEIENCQFWGYNGKTYLIETNRPNEISKISPESWFSLKNNLQDDD